jgi:D-threo-aldose 1-dehydrogenase
MESTSIPQVLLGSRDLMVNEYSLGCAPLGALPRTSADDEMGRAMLQAAWDGGIRTYDVAPFYGHGLGEVRLGRFLVGHPRDDYVLSTKVGRVLVPAEDGIGDPEPVFDFSRDGILRSLEDSLARLQVDRVDLALIHDPDNHFDAAMDQAYPAVEELRAAGVVRAIGFGMNQAGMLERFVRNTDIDCVLVAGRYTLLDDRAADLFQAALECGVGILAAGVFNSGILADPRPGATFNYRPASAALLERAGQLRDFAGRHGVPLSRLALQYPLRHPAVSSILVGAQSADEVVANLVEYTAPVPEGLWDELARSGLTGWAGLE